MKKPRARSVHAETPLEDLINEVESGRVSNPGFNVSREMEAIRRLIDSTDRWSRRMVMLTIVLVLFTAALIGLSLALLQRP